MRITDESPARTADPSFSSGFLSGIGGQILCLGFSFPASILIARLLGPERKGSVDLALLLPSLVTLFSSFGLGSAGSYLIGSRAFPLIEVTGSLMSMWLIVSSFLLPMFSAAAVVGWLAPIAPHVDRDLLLLGGLFIPLSLGRQYLGSILLGRQWFIPYNGIAIVYALSNLAGITVLVWIVAGGARGAVISALIAQAACVVFILALLRRLGSVTPRWNREVIREAGWYGVRGQAGNILQFFNYRLDTILLGHFRGLGEVGIYTLAVSLAEVLWYIPNASALVIFPRTASTPEEARRLTPLVFRITAGLTLGAAAALAIVVRPLIMMIYSHAFAGSVLPLLLLLPGIVCLGGAKVLSADLSGRGLPEYNTKVALISLGVTLLLDFALIPRWGACGAAVASSLAYATSLVYSLIAYTRVTGASLGGTIAFRRADLRELRQTLARIRVTRTR